MRHLAAALAIALAVVALPALGQTTPPANPSKVFVTVDAVQVKYYQVIVTGIVQGEATPSTYYVQANASDAAANMGFMQACQQQALLAMSKPGQYLLEILQSGSMGASTCKLTRVSP
jgi:hypothetical protein